MKYDCLVHLYNLYYEKDGNIVKGGLYTNCFIECNLNKLEPKKVEELENDVEEENETKLKSDNDDDDNDDDNDDNNNHDYNSICQKAGNYVGDSLQDFIKNPESDPVKFEIEKVAVYDENTSKLMGLALYRE